MKFSLRKLPSGLRILYVPMSSSESSTITIWVKTGSRNEDPRIQGISHFLEHMVFKGSKKRPTAKKISEIVDGIGGEFNAATSKDWTNFYIKTRNGSVNIAFDILSDMVLNPILDSKEIEREKGTIVQEIAMYDDTPMIKISDVFENLAFGDHALGRDIAGTEETVRRIVKNDFLRYRDLHYYPENILVSVAGGVSIDNVEKLTSKYFRGIEKLNSAKNNGTKKGEEYVSDQSKPQVLIKKKKSDQANFILGFKAQGRNYKGRFAQSVLAAILGAGMSSRLFIQVRERRGLAYSVRTSVERYDETGYIGTYAGTDPKKAYEAVRIILDEHYGLAKGTKRISAKELAKAKEFIKGHLALNLEDTHGVSSFFGEQELFLPKVLTPEEIFENIDAVTVKDVCREAKDIFRPEKLNLAVIGPFNDGKKFVELLK